MSGSSKPQPAYQRGVGSSSVLDINREFYSKIHTSIESKTPYFSLTIPIRSARAWKVCQGEICRIVAVEGAQVGDLNIWNYHNPREHMWASRTRQLERAHLSTYDRIWSTLPYLRPLVTITGDTLENYGVDNEGGRVHDLLGTRCDPYVNQMLTGEVFDYSCHSNLTRAILPYGLTELDVHDVLNVFQCTGLTEDDKYFMKCCPALRGDYFEFFAEIDILCALSACPSGDQSAPLWGPGSSDKELIKNCRPLGVQVYHLEERELEGWEEPQRANYKNTHGLKCEEWRNKE